MPTIRREKSGQTILMTHKFHAVVNNLLTGYYTVHFLLEILSSTTTRHFQSPHSYGVGSSGCGAYVFYDLRQLKYEVFILYLIFTRRVQS